MGSHQRERYGEEMVIVGFDFYAGEFNAMAWKNGQPAGGLRTHRVDAPPSGSYEAYFHSAGMPRMILDLRGIDDGSSATSWLAGPRMMRSIGAAYDDAMPANYLYPARLPKEYDVIVYFENTTPSRLLPMRR
jgi:erythromycin esterase-like protein